MPQYGRGTRVATYCFLVNKTDMTKTIDSSHNVKFLDDGLLMMVLKPQSLPLGIRRHHRLRYTCRVLSFCFFFKFLDCQGGWVEHNHSLYCMTRNRRGQIQNARQRCKEMSANLPIIKSQSENDFVLSLMKKQTTVWLGMERNKTGFFWFDGSPAEPSQGAVYSAWKDNELKTRVNEECALLESSTRKWRDHKCHHEGKAYVLCQKGRA